MKYFIDAEFEEDGTTIIPISLGIAAEDGRTLYLINKEYVKTYISYEAYYWKGNASVITPWISQNVMTHITPEDVTEFGVSYEDWGPIIQNFISDNGKYKSRDEVELWGWYAAYDHVLLAQVYGPMINLPEPIPMFTNDIETVRRGQEPIRRSKHQPEHNALYDAIYQMQLYENWTVLG